METYEIDHTIFTQQQKEADKALLVRFYTKSVQDRTQSAKEGRPIFRDKEYVEIRFPGNRTDAVARPATAADKARFPEHYKAFKDRVDMPEVGTPLSEWPAISRSQAEELAFYHIKTVEQLASVNDAQGQKFMGFNGLRQKAKEFLELSRGVVEATQLRDELKQRDDMIATMQKQLDQLMSQSKEEKPKFEGEVSYGEQDMFAGAEPMDDDGENEVKPRKRRPPLKRSAGD